MTKEQDIIGVKISTPEHKRIKTKNSSAESVSLMSPAKIVFEASSKQPELKTIQTSTQLTNATPVEIFSIKNFISTQESREKQAMKLTKKMQEVQAKHAQPGEDLGDLLRRLYWHEGKTQEQIGKELEIHHTHISHWMKKLNIEVYARGHRPIDPETKKRIGQAIRSSERHKQAIRSSWQDPEKSQKRIKKLNSPEAKRKRSSVMKKYYDDHPDQRVKIWIKRKKAAEKRRKDLLGENPNETLRTMYWERQMSVEQIAKELGLARSTIGDWLTQFGIPKRKPGSMTTGVARNVKEDIASIVEQAINSGIIDKLSPRDAEILRMRYEQKLTFNRIGQQIGLSEERARLLEAEAFRRLQKLQKPRVATEDTGHPATQSRIIDLDLPTRVRHALLRTGIMTVEQLLEKSDQELLAIKGFGPDMLSILREFLASDNHQ